uniref:Bloodthirsty n=1 Tax=Sander lucioperca TaxID=283035 RepID=A0A8C9X8S6_SANLU
FASELEPPMAILSSEDQFMCSICLDVFTDPVATPCGHNFCKNCIIEHWNTNDQYLCPMCKEASSSKVPCDVCTGTKLKALKSCLVCLASYCETHLEPHLTMSGLKRHELIDPVENLEGRMCTKHDKTLELFCKTDQTCVCMLCTVLDHKMHDVVPLKEEYEGKKVELGKTGAEIQHMIQKRRLKIQEVKHSVDLKKQAKSLIKELEQEISELMKRSTEVEQVLRSEDHLHLLQSVQSLNTQQPPPTKDWTEVSVRPSSYEGTVVKAVVQMEETLVKQMKKRLAESELKRVQQYAVDVTFDPDTAYPDLILSDDGKQVNLGDVRKNLPDIPERFSNIVCVLGRQSFSSGRFYFEVQVKGKTKWTLGVVRESINRKGSITASPQKVYWTILLRNRNEYEALADPPVRLSLKSPPQKVGVFVDYEEGLVSFYDVDAAALIYSFTGCSFTEKLFPFFSPCINDGGKNSAPLVISPVRVN